MKSETPLDEIRKNWVLIMCIVSIIASWTMQSSRLAQAEKDIEDLQALSAEIRQQGLDIAVIKNDVGYIKERIK